MSKKSIQSSYGISRVIALLLAMIMVLGLMPAFAADEVPGEVVTSTSENVGGEPAEDELNVPGPDAVDATSEPDITSSEPEENGSEVIDLPATTLISGAADKTYYVADPSHGGDDLKNADGSREQPLMTLGFVREKAKQDGVTDYTIAFLSDLKSEHEIEFTEGTIILKSADGEKHTISYTGTSPLGNDDGFLSIRDGANVTFEGINLAAADGQVQARVVYVAKGGTATITDSVVTKGRWTSNSAVRGGSAIFVSDGGTVVLGGTTKVTGNTTTSDGTIFVANGGNLTVQDNVEISGNTALHGAGIYVEGAAKDEGLVTIKDNVQIINNTANAGGSGAGVYVADDTNVTVQGEVRIKNNKVTGGADSNVYLAKDASFDISGTTVNAEIGISADPEYCFRLISLPYNGYEIAQTSSGDEKGWFDDCGKWDIRYLDYQGVPGLYLYYFTVGAQFSDVGTIEELLGKDAGQNEKDFMKDKVPGGTNDGHKLTAPDIIPRSSDAGDVTFKFTVDPVEYRIPAEEYVKVESGGKELEFEYEGNIAEGWYTVTVPAEELDGLAEDVIFTITADKYHNLTIQMDGPLFTMSTNVTELSEQVLVLSGTKTGTGADYTVTKGGAPISGILIELHRADTNGLASSLYTDVSGKANFTGLEESAAYQPILKYSFVYRVIAKDTMNLNLSVLSGQELADDYTKTGDATETASITYTSSLGTASISNIQSDTVVIFKIKSAKDTIVFHGNEGKASTAPATIIPGSKEMEAGAANYGELASAELTGYTFQGWYTDPTSSDNKVEANTPYDSGTSARDLYAHWTPNTDTAYTVQHWVELAEDGVNVGYTKDVTQTKFDNGKTYYLYTSNSYKNGTSDAPIDISGLDLKEMNDETYTWWTREGFTARPETGCVVLANGSSVFSIYYDRNHYNIHFNNDGEGTAKPDPHEALPDKDVAFGDKIGELPEPHLPGYEFGGWYDDVTESVVVESDIYTRTDDSSVTAKWNARSDTKWAIKIYTQDVYKDSSDVWHPATTYTEYKTVYTDNDGNLLTGTTDTSVTKNISEIDALTIKGFTYAGYADSPSQTASNMTPNTTSFTVYIDPTDASTQREGALGPEYNEDFDGGIVYLYYTRNTSKVTVDPSYPGVGDKESKDPDIVYGGDFEGHLPPDPGRDGYDFSGWEDEEGNPVGPDSPADDYTDDPDDDGTVIHPTWTARKYQLTFVPGHGTTFTAVGGGKGIQSSTVAGGYIDPHEYVYDEKFGTLPTAHKVGHNFDGWFINDGGMKITSDMTLSVDNVVISNAPVYNYEDTKPLYAQYTPHHYTVILHPGESSVTHEKGTVTPDRIEVTFGEQVNDLPTPSLRGYRFVAWVFDVRNPSTTFVNGDYWDREFEDGAEVHLYATYVPETYRYTFDLNDGIGSTRATLVDTTITHVDQDFDAVYDGIFEVEATRPGYRFMGWSLTRTGDVLTADDLNGINSNVTLYAIWEPLEYEVRLYLNGGSIPAMNDNEHLETYDPTAEYHAEGDYWSFLVKFDTEYGDLPFASKTKCDFLGWLGEAAHWPALNGVIVSAIPSWTDYEDKDGIAFYAQWDPYITFDPQDSKFTNDGTTDPKDIPQSKLPDPLPETEKDDYTFKGWVDPENPDDILDPDDLKNFDEPKTVIPKFVPNIDFDANGGKMPNGEEKQTYPFDELPNGKLPTPKREGYDFLGWEENGKIVKSPDDIDDGKPHDLVARWAFEVTFDANGGTVEGKDKIAKNIEELMTANTLPTATRSGYTFDGWFTSRTGGDKVTLDSLKATNEPVTVFAHWTYNAPPSPGGGGGGGFTPTPPTPSFKLEFDSNGGTDVPSQNVPSGDTAEKPEDPTKPGFAFDGWYKDPECTEPWDFDKDVVTDDTTLYAKWTAFDDDHVAYIKGYNDGYVRPNNDITRAEVAMIFYRLLRDELRSQYETTDNEFSDIAAGAWYESAVSTLARMGIIRGYADGTFRPNDPITRAEFAAIAARFDTVAEDTPVRFSDVDPSFWAYDYIGTAAAKGYVQGYPDGTFRPNNNITRAEAMTLINRVLGRDKIELDSLLDGMIEWPDNADTNAWYYLAVQEATNSHDHEFVEGVEQWLALVEFTVIG